MNLDVKTGVQTAFFLAIIGLILSFLLGLRSIESGRKLTFFKKRRDLMSRGWRLLAGSLIFLGLSYFLYGYAEPTVYIFFKPSPTITITPTITLTPTITQSPTITLTPSITPTSEFSPTPQLPINIIREFKAKVTPNPDSVFSSIVFTKQIDNEKLPIKPALEFANPVIKLYGTFSYDKMLVGSQWTALWLRLENHEVICYETKPWDGSTGGYGVTECQPSSDKWLPGRYEVQIYIGENWVVQTGFLITGQPIKPTITRTQTRTVTNTYTITPSRTITTSKTITPSKTITLTPTPSQTSTPRPTNTNTITSTPSRTTRPLIAPGFITPTN